tara:strand:- start:1228 stop:1881 length:654 start_codon:yes stop_codon:yes gene_type:complete
MFAPSNTSPKDKPVPKVCQHYDNLGDRLPHNIVGSTEWAINNHLVQGNPGNPEIMVYNAAHKTRLIITDNGKYTKDGIIAQTELVNNIISFTNENDWKQIDSGENQLNWVTPKYPDKVFGTGRIHEKSSGETHYFPVSDTNNDPLGIATHYKVSSSGNSCTIEHNGFTAYGNSKARSFWRYRTKRNKRLTEQNKHNAELLDESVKAERLLNLGPVRA